MLAIDGTMHEGGGGLLRYALFYASILNKPVKIHSIRANRPNVQGLQPGHSTTIDTMKLLTAASVEGNAPYSREIRFTPHASPVALSSHVPRVLDVMLEGPATLLFAALLPYILFSHVASAASQFTPAFDLSTSIQLTIRGGTLCVKSPSIFYIRQVFLPTLELIGITAENVHFLPDYEQGWFTDGPKLPGKIVACIKPLNKRLDGFILKRRGPVAKLQVTAHVPANALLTFRSILQAELKSAIPMQTANIDIVSDVFESVLDGQYHMLITATTASPTAYIGFETICPLERLFPPDLEGDNEKIGCHLIRTCIRGLWKELRHGNSVDEHMEDFLIVYQSMATGFSSAVAKGEERQVDAISANYSALSTSHISRGECITDTPLVLDSSIYDLDTMSLHRKTSWWLVDHMAGVKLEERTVNDEERVGCVGLGFGTDCA
jgi:RNA 3'-terminal phosphate cyclase (ATP)